MSNFLVRKSSFAKLKIAEEEQKIDSESLNEDEDDLPTAMQGEEFDIGMGKDTDSDVGLEEDTQTSPVMLNQLLADFMVLFTKTLNYHWNIQGLHFNHLHEMLGVQYESLLATVDSIAERIRSLGEFPTGFMAGWLQITKLEESETSERKAKEMLDDLVKDYITIVSSIKKYNKVMLDDLDDQGTSDFLLGIQFDLEKRIWMLKSSIKEI